MKLSLVSVVLFAGLACACSSSVAVAPKTSAASVDRNFPDNNTTTVSTKESNTERLGNDCNWDFQCSFPQMCVKGACL